MKTRPSSVPSLLEVLWKEGVFRKARSLAEISREVAARGYHPRGSNLAVTLMRSVRVGGHLTRVRKDGQWKYIQKHPVVSASRQRTELFGRYDFHPVIKKVALQQFQNGDFKGAILNAFIEVVNQVKVAAGNPKDQHGRDIDGDDLMNRTFGCDNQEPSIRFNGLGDGLDRAEQRGLMYLFKGVVGIRDKKAHLNFIQQDPLKTIEYLSLASLLLRLLDENAGSSAKKAKNPARLATQPSVVPDIPMMVDLATGTAPSDSLVATS